MAACIICGDPKTVAKGRCGCCYSYWRRNGRDRGFELIIRLTEKDIEAEIIRRQRARRGWDSNI